MTTSMDIWHGGNRELIWDKFCGHLRLSLPSFMHIQEMLLMEQIRLLQGCELGRRVLGNQKMNSLEDFRRKVPFTTYQDYEADLLKKREDILPAKTRAWVITTGTADKQKWVPVSNAAYDVLVDSMLGLFILSSSKKEADFSLKPGDVMFNIAAPRPFFAGMGVRDVTKSVGLRLMPPDNDEFNKLPFFEGIAKGFEMGMRTGIDLIVAVGSLIVGAGQSFRMPKVAASDLLNPVTGGRILRGWMQSRMSGSNILPGDLWRLKGLLATGTDLPFFAPKIRHYWRKEPWEFYINTECACYIGSPVWKRQAMTFYPYAGFLEFLPLELPQRMPGNPEPQIVTKLLDQVEVGKQYELIFTSFNGGVFARYHTGDVIQFVALKDEGAGVKLPQFLLKGRADKLIDIGNFTRIDEKTIWQALEASGIQYNGWMARKEVEEGEPVLSVYLDSPDGHDEKGLAGLFDGKLQEVDSSYKSLKALVSVNPLRLKLLPSGTLSRWEKEALKAGRDFAWVKEQRMQAPDQVLEEILKMARDDKTN